MSVIEGISDEKLGSGEATASNGILSVDEIQELTNYAFERLNKGVQSYDWTVD